MSKIELIKSPDSHPLTWLICLCFFLSTNSQAQMLDTIDVKRPAHSINVGLVGDGSHYSINYEFANYYKHSFIAIEVGLGYNRSGTFCFRQKCNGDGEVVLTTPVHFTANLGAGHHFFEIGIGAVLAFFGDPPTKILVYPQIGYRYMPTEPYNPNFKFYFQIPDYFKVDKQNNYFIPFGLSIGFSF